MASLKVGSPRISIESSPSKSIERRYKIGSKEGKVREETEPPLDALGPQPIGILVVLDGLYELLLC